MFRPTWDEFKDFSGYMEKIEREHKVHEIGLCKVIVLDGVMASVSTRVGNLVITYTRLKTLSRGMRVLVHHQSWVCSSMSSSRLDRSL